MLLFFFIQLIKCRAENAEKPMGIIKHTVTGACTAGTEGCVEKTALLLQRQQTQRTVKLVTEMVLILLFKALL